jgi:hypothetical protein
LLRPSQSSELIASVMVLGIEIETSKDSEVWTRDPMIMSKTKALTTKLKWTLQDPFLMCYISPFWDVTQTLQQFKKT